MTAQLLRVMYAPLDYIHSDHFHLSDVTLAPAVKSAINHQLIRRFDLSTALDFDLRSNDVGRRLVTEWDSVRQAAWLIGCKLARGTLARHGHFAKLPQSARQFVAIPLICPALDLTEPVTRSSLEIHGGRCLLALSPHLPVAIAQRLALLLPSGSERDPWQGPLNRSLLTFAFDYAKTTVH